MTNPVRKIFVVPDSRPDSEAAEIDITKDPDSTREYVIDELRKYSEYRVWMLAGTQIGDGPPSPAVVVKTDEDGAYSFYCTGLNRNIISGRANDIHNSTSTMNNAQFHSSHQGMWLGCPKKTAACPTQGVTLLLPLCSVPLSFPVPLAAWFRPV